MAKQLKRMMVAQYERELEGENGLIVVDPGPMSVETAQAIRHDLREKAGGAEMRIIHNRTARLALREGLFADRPEVLDEILTGPSAIVFGGEGPVPIAKVLKEWKKKFKPLRVKGGVAQGDVLDQADVEGLADLPDLPQLRGMMLGAILGTARGIAASLEGVYGGLARVLQARVDASGEEVDTSSDGGEADASDGGGDAPAEEAGDAAEPSEEESGG